MLLEVVVVEGGVGAERAAGGFNVRGGLDGAGACEAGILEFCGSREFERLLRLGAARVLELLRLDRID